jgi:DNA-binding transcriptional LysR family regulator
VFLVKARQLLAQADEAVLHVRKSARGELGHIAVGYTSSAAMHEAVPALLKAFGTHYPLITLSVTENNTRTLLEAVREQKLTPYSCVRRSRAIPHYSRFCWMKSPW